MPLLMFLWSLTGCGFPECGSTVVSGTGLTFVNPDGVFPIDETYGMLCGQQGRNLAGSLNYRAPSNGEDAQLYLYIGPYEHPADELIMDALTSHHFYVPAEPFTVGTRWEFDEMGSFAQISGLTGSGYFEDLEGNTSSELLVQLPPQSGWLELTAFEMDGDCDPGDGSLADREVNFRARFDLELTHGQDGATAVVEASDIWMNQRGYLETNPALGSTPVDDLCGRFGSF